MQAWGAVLDSSEIGMAKVSGVQSSRCLRVCFGSCLLIGDSCCGRRMSSSPHAFQGHNNVQGWRRWRAANNV
jgi:hypothetical protein